MRNYSNAYAEVYTIINHMEEEEQLKIPERIRNVFREKRNKDYEYEFDYAEDLKEQEMLPETKAILFNIFRDYLATKEQKEKIIKMQQEYRQKNEEAKNQKYNTDVFNNSISNISINSNGNEEKSLIVKEEIGIIQKIKNFFKKLFHKEKIDEVPVVNSIKQEQPSLREEYKTKQDILNLQQQYESGKILEKDISEEDKEKLIELYQEQLITLNSNIKEYKNLLKDYKEKILAIKREGEVE